MEFIPITFSWKNYSFLNSMAGGEGVRWAGVLGTTRPRVTLGSLCRCGESSGLGRYSCKWRDCAARAPALPARLHFRGFHAVLALVNYRPLDFYLPCARLVTPPLSPLRTHCHQEWKFQSNGYIVYLEAFHLPPTGPQPSLGRHLTNLHWYTVPVPVLYLLVWL